MTDVIEYLIDIGTLTQTGEHIFEQIHVQDGQITYWGFPEPQMSENDINAVRGTQGFTDYVSNIANRRARRKARKIVETDLRRFAEIILDEINILRAREGLVPRTMSQLKSAMDTKD